MPQLDLVSFPSQVFWLAIIFFIFYSFVSGHFVPLLHKIIQTRAKKVAIGQEVTSGQSDEHSSVIVSSEALVLSSLEKSISGLSSCTTESSLSQYAALRSGDKSKVSSLSQTISSIQGR